ncbi:uncharacterized protein RCC_00670 [Ramularia collo-cygni]|uniref:YqcI/YcgG family protein n=1 Tax=Ramularia collo-cygni TaxID=112498 RepID=A0A2D3UZP6_9PEZI|nr:uncharacterized protein RCC_00670 [Ramularia collo-cygni]CZT14699.1 uncharacterized protein RCC_00670 [Ramularia collo-cygni]
MQVALNILLFLAGFSIATFLALRPKKAREDVERLTSNLRHYSDGFIQNLSKKEQSCGEEGLVVSNEATNLLTKEQIEEMYDMNAWQRTVYEEFKTTILAKGKGFNTFPCIYATMGYRSGDHRYVFLHSDDPSEPRNIRLIGPALKSYLRLSRSLGPNTSLVIMGAPTEGEQRTVEEYNHNFWEMLRGLRIWDAVPWPADVPQDTESAKWAFCFDGEPLFPVALTPAHQKRWSRHAPVPLVALQPKWVLDNLLSTPEKRASATGKVRTLLAQYDQTEISPDLTQYGEVGTSEVHQLCLRDENTTVECPYGDFDKGGPSPASSRRASREYE